jgi:hypothetical protein
LKLFYRSLPESIVTNKLLEEFIKIGEIIVADKVPSTTVEDSEENESQIETIQEICSKVSKLMHQLPLNNYYLLKCTIIVFHAISLNATVNRMNVTNVSICTAPSVIFGPNSAAKFMFINALMEFMIGHCGLIFGMDSIEYWDNK